MAPWRSGDAADCKSEADAIKSISYKIFLGKPLAYWLKIRGILENFCTLKACVMYRTKSALKAYDIVR